MFYRRGLISFSFPVGRQVRFQGCRRRTYFHRGTYRETAAHDRFEQFETSIHSRTAHENRLCDTIVTFITKSLIRI